MHKIKEGFIAFFTKDILRKILSIVFAIIAWIIIINYEDPVKTTTFYNIETEITNESALSNLSKTYEVLEGNTSTVKIKGKQSILNKINSSDIHVYADLSKLSQTNSVPLEIYVDNYNENVETSFKKTNTLKVSLDDYISKKFEITVNQTNELIDGFYISDLSSDSKYITISGPKNKIGRISKVIANVEITTDSEQFKTKVSPTLYDNNNSIIDYKDLTLSLNQLTITADILGTKTIPIIFNLKNNPANGYQLNSYTQSIDSILIAGKKDVLDNITQLEINYDLSNKTKSFTDTIKISDYLSNDVLLLDDVESVDLKVTIDKDIYKTIKIYKSNIKIQNLSEDMKLQILSKNFNIKISGPENIIKDITEDNFNYYIDLSNLDEGNHEIELKFNKNEDINIDAKYTINIELTKIETLIKNTTEENNP